MNEGSDNNEFPPGENGSEDTQLASGKPAVAAAPGKMMIVVVFAAIFIFIVVKSLFFGGPKEVSAVKPQKEQVIAKTETPSSENIKPSDLPSPPPPPPAITAAPPPPPPPPVALPSPVAPPLEVGEKRTPTNEALKARIHAPMVSGGGAFSSLTASSNQKKRAAVTPSSDPNSAFAQSAADMSNAESVEATKIGDLNRTIAQGKLIQGVLETAIDSTLPGDVRAIVSHDTYAESGRAILIPKGSRIIGTYNSSVRRGQARVFIIWTRVIRPDGVDIAIDSPGIDALGRAGLTGDVDNKYFETFSTAILTSTMDIGVAAAGDALFGNQQQTTTTGSSGTTTTSSPTATAMQTAVQNLGTVGQSIVANQLSLMPTINIDQGEIINIFVSKDLIFPARITGESTFIE